MLQEAQKWLMLNAIDQAWKQHMLNLDHLKEGIGLRGMGQKNPLIEYKKEAYNLFEEMMRSIRFEIIHHIYHLNMNRFDRAQFERERERELEDVQMSGGSEADINKTPTQVFVLKLLLAEMMTALVALARNLKSATASK